MLNIANAHTLTIAKSQMEAIDRISKNQAQEPRPEPKVTIQEPQITDKNAIHKLNDAIHKLNDAIQGFNDNIQMLNDSLQKDTIQRANVRKDKIRKPNSRSKSRSRNKADCDAITYGCTNFDLDRWRWCQRVREAAKSIEEAQVVD